MVFEDKALSAALCVYNWNACMPHRSDAAFLMTILHELCSSDELDTLYKGFMREQGLDEVTDYRISKLIGIEPIKSTDISKAQEAMTLCKFCEEHEWPAPNFIQTGSNEWIPTIDNVYVSGAELKELKERSFFTIADLSFYTGDGGVTLICK